MIIGTAGHIDHGKTTLVKALSGVDTDRLPEEKERRISIQLGYAFLDAPDGERLAFVDVPGHEKLVHTMISGASGMDFALLLIAADDGVMPQTREHLAVLSMLGITRGAIVITKTDQVTPDRVQSVRQAARQLTAGSAWSAAPLFAVSAIQGTGVDVLRLFLFEQAQQNRSKLLQNSAQAARLAIDRAFSLPGAGTVVTGSLHAGCIRTGDELALAPASNKASWRVRSLHAQDQQVQEAFAGQRCAVALVGLPLEQVQRGQWLVHPDIALSTQRMDVQLQLWHEEEQALRSGRPVQIHIGASQVPGTVAILDAATLLPGQNALAQLVLHAPTAAWHGERIILRDPAARRTLAGGIVLDPQAPSRYRRTAARLKLLKTQQIPATSKRLYQLVEQAENGLDLQAFACHQGLLHWPEQAISHDALRQVHHVLSASACLHLSQKTLASLETFHRQHPDELGPDANRLRRLAAPRLNPFLWQALLQQLAHTGRIIQQGACVHLPSHGIELSATEQRIAQRVAPIIAEARFQGAWMRDLARATGETEVLMRTTLARLGRSGQLHQVVRDLYYDDASMHELARLVRQLARQHDGDIKAADFRDATHLGRKRAIQILEHFDRLGLTRRVGDIHRLRDDNMLFT